MIESIHEAEHIPTFENIWSFLDYVKRNRELGIIDGKLNINSDQSTFLSILSLIKFLDKSISRDIQPNPLIKIKSKLGELNNIDQIIEDISLQGVEDILEIKIDLVLLNEESLYTEYNEKKEAHKIDLEERTALGNKIELDPNLPSDLKEIKDWPKDIPNFNLMGSWFIYQLGDLPCYAKVGPDPKNEGFFEAQMIWTDPEFRNMGYGTQMLKLLRKQFPKLTMTPITKEGAEINQKLIDSMNV